MTDQLPIDDMKAQLIAEIQARSMSQVETWKQLPYYGWLSWGLSGYSDTEYHMFAIKVLKLAIFDHNGSYTIGINLNTGEIVKFTGAPLTKSDTRFVLQINDGDIDAAGYIQRMKDHISKYDTTEKKLDSVTALKYDLVIPDGN